MPELHPELLDELRAAVGDALHTDAATRHDRRMDRWVRSHLVDWQGDEPESPGCVVQARSVADVQAVVRIAARHGAAVMPYGLGSGVCGGIRPDAGVVLLDMSTMQATRFIDPDNLLASFDAGTNGLEAEERVAAVGCTIGHWPQSIAISSVGGWVATRATGQFSTAYGGIEELVHSIEAVLPNGELVVLGRGPRAAAGPDLRHLLMGAEGTMGIVTGVTFSLRRQSEARRFSVFYAGSLAQGLEVQRRIIQADWRPPVMRLYDASEVVRNFNEWADGDTCLLVLMHEGPAARVEAEIGAIAKIAAEAGLVPGPAEAGDAWMERRNHVPEWKQLFELGLIADTVEISATWSDIGGIYDAVTASLREVNGVLNASAHSSHAYRSGINLYFTFAAAVPAEQMAATYDECWRRVMQATLAGGGSIAHHHGIGRLRRPWLADELGTGGLALLRTLKDAVDPAGIMNPKNLLPDT